MIKLEYEKMALAYPLYFGEEVLFVCKLFTGEYILCQYDGAKDVFFVGGKIYGKKEVNEWAYLPLDNEELTVSLVKLRDR